MDRIRLERGLVRTQFTKGVKAIQELLTAETVNKEDVAAKFAVLKSNQGRLTELNRQLHNLLFTEKTDDNILTELEEEFKMCDEYDEKLFNTELKVEAALSFQNDFASQSPTPSKCGSTAKIRSYKLPKIELKVFDGNLLEWLGWWA
jgi:hypothetical protein